MSQGNHQYPQHHGPPVRGYNAHPAPDRVSHGSSQASHHHVSQHSPEAPRQSAPHTQDSTPLSSCQICSYTQPYPARQLQVFHRNYSSLRLKELLGVENTKTEYLCPSCKCKHIPYPDERVKIVLSDSTLHQFFAPPVSPGSQYVGDMMHVDYITIKEAYIQDLIQAFRLDYELLEHPKPLDVVVVAGYHDLQDKHSRAFIMEGFEHLIKLVQGLKTIQKPLTHVP